MFLARCRSRIKQLACRFTGRRGSYRGAIFDTDFPDDLIGRNLPSLPVWGIRLSIENTYLSWTRNSIIATTAGLLMTQYKVDHTNLQRMPTSGAGILFLGASFMVLGPMQYIHTYWRLKTVLELTGVDWACIGLNSAWFPVIWMSSMYCFVHGAPPTARKWMDDFSSGIGQAANPTIHPE
eukprot:gnl/TRDRNA2_/TRDRNA2_27483_c0_seq1.p1 gnl/TRDRNA2_/TRDRNA2_27483_c0~~gnl/TRDRNA2_/TRDRNA2_27483_c0_seq1.p1  ORF type:complete len:180 (-),score=0.95 gnl/TRDRNA2_/TRDRNA2_27483_c0_seq1:35-574(-)